MIFNTNLDDLNTVNVMLGWLSAFRTNDPRATFVQMLLDDGARQPQVRYRPGDITSPGLLIGVTDVGFVALADSCQSFGQGLGFFNGYIGDPFITNRDPSNAYTNNAANYIRALLQQTSAPLVGVPYLCGYSLGGAIVTAYAADYTRRNGVIPKTLTFGCPRILGASDARSINLRGANVRVMNDDDPIPLVPLRFTDSPAQVLLMFPDQLRTLAYYVHVEGGLSLAANGNLTPSELPPRAAANPQTSLAQWLFSSDTTPQGPHGIDNYRSRIALAIQIQNRANPVAPNGAPQERPNPVTPRQESQQSREFINTVFNFGEAQNVQPPIIPVEQEMTVFRQDRVWCVAWRGQVVAIGPTKRRARAMAREGNQFLRRLQTLAYVNTDEVSGSLAGYLQDASSPTTVFVPPIQNQLPA